MFFRLSVSIVLAKNFTGETGTVEKEKKSVDNWPFCEGVVDNIGNPTGHPADLPSGSLDGVSPIFRVAQTKGSHKVHASRTAQ